MPLPCAAYQPRAAERGVLYRVVEAHLDAFLDAAAQHAEGSRLPSFVEQEFRDFLTCGVLTRGFARLQCGECGFERLAPPVDVLIGDHTDVSVNAVVNDVLVVESRSKGVEYAIIEGGGCRNTQLVV